jgi:peptidylprolyl isomerase
VRPASRRLGALLLIPATVLGLTACGSGGSGSSTSSAPASASSSTPAPEPSSTEKPVSADVGIKVAGKFGETPTLTIPSTKEPSQLTEQVLGEGSGAAAASGDTLVANYVGQTWAPKDGKPNVFDSSFARKQPAAFVIGKGAVISGWDKILVGKKAGSRVLLVIPPADGYGKAGRPEAGIRGTDDLVFVVDVIASYAPDASAPGTAVTALPAGLPKIDNVPGKEPKITDVAGVKEPTAPASTLLVKGSGAAIDAKKSVVLQMVQTDLATAAQTQATWGTGPQLVPAEQLFSLVDVLKGQRVGARAVVLLPPSTSSSGAAQPAQILIVDVIGQV